MKILHLISSQGLFGAENVVLNLSSALNNGEIISIVGALHNQSNPHLEIIERARELGCPTYVLDCNGRIDFVAIWRLKRFIKENKVSVLHTHNYKSNTFGVIAAKLAGVPIVATAHGYTDIDHKVTRYEQLDRWILRNLFNKVVVVSDKVIPKLSQNKKRIISNGFDIDKFIKQSQHRLEIRRKYKIEDHEVVVGTVGRLSKEKNQLLLIEAAAELVKKNNQLKFLIVGIGPEEEALRQRVRELNLEEKVIFTGLIKDMPSIYQAIDIFVLPSLTEGIPLTILEAMAAEISVLATKVGGIPELINDGETGMLVQSKNKNDLIEKLETLIQNKDLRSRFSQNALEFVKKSYSKERMAKEYREVYEEIIKGKL